MVAALARAYGVLAHMRALNAAHHPQKHIS